MLSYLGANISCWAVMLPGGRTELYSPIFVLTDLGSAIPFAPYGFGECSDCDMRPALHAVSLRYRL